MLHRWETVLFLCYTEESCVIPVLHREEAGPVLHREEAVLCLCYTEERLCCFCATQRREGGEEERGRGGGGEGEEEERGRGERGEREGGGVPLTSVSVMHPCTATALASHSVNSVVVWELQRSRRSCPGQRSEVSQ